MESTLLVIKEVLVYKIPPRNTSKGMKAADWDVSQFLWSGRLRVLTVGDDCFIKLEDPATGQLFGQVNYDLSGTAVEPVTDSSRYFVIKIEDPATKRHAFVGLGFQDRNEAFDFNVTLQDHLKHIKQRKEAFNRSQQQSNQPPADFTLKQNIRINIGGIAKKNIQANTGGDLVSTSNNSGDDFEIFKLAPPPKQQVNQSNNNNSDNGWSQF